MDSLYKALGEKNLQQILNECYNKRKLDKYESENNVQYLLQMICKYGNYYNDIEISSKYRGNIDKFEFFDIIKIGNGETTNVVCR